MGTWRRQLVGVWWTVGVWLWWTVEGATGQESPSLVLEQQQQQQHQQHQHQHQHQHQQHQQQQQQHQHQHQQQHQQQQHQQHDPQGVTGALEAIIKVAISMWDREKLQHVADLRRTVRQTGRQVRDISAYLYPALSYASLFTQVLSLAPIVVAAAVSAVSAVVSAVGLGVALTGTGITYSGQAVHILGNIIEAVAAKVPTLITMAVLGGISLLFMYPDLQERFFSTVASSGLELAGMMASGFRSYVPDDSVWATLIDTFRHLVLTLKNNLLA